MTHDITEMTHAQFSTWLVPIIGLPFFLSHERFVVLLGRKC